MPKANFVPIGDNGLLIPRDANLPILPVALSFYPHPKTQIESETLDPDELTRPHPAGTMVQEAYTGVTRGASVGRTLGEA
jgi:hypothetical protein